MKIAIVAGGTGGHLYPGIALARALKGLEVSFLVRTGDLGRDILRREGFPVYEIRGAGLPRKVSVQLLMYPFTFIRGMLDAKRILSQLLPDRIVGMGGYLSVPVVLWAWILRIPSLIHEQNVYPGLANRILSLFANSVAVSFPESQAAFPNRKSWVSGLPIRGEFRPGEASAARLVMELDPHLKTYLVFGGSLGARRLNQLMPEVWKALIARGESFQVLHITGPADHEAVIQQYAILPLRSRVIPYCHDMPNAYAASDLVICRSGASTVCEVLMSQRRAIFIPYPHATNQHQLLNARMAQSRGQADVLEENDLSVDRLVSLMTQNHSDKPLAPSPDMERGAAERLAAYLTGPVL